MTSKSLKGSCLCRAVTFEVTLPSKWCAHCHCGMCRKYHGAGYVTFAGFDNEQFKVLSGADALTWFSSSKQGERAFCKQCGSSLLFRSMRWPGETHVALGCLDGDIDRKPEAHVCHDSRVDWMAIDDALNVIGLDE